MRKRSAEEKQKQLERFLMNVAEAADAALWEYWREKEAEHRRFATEYVTRRGGSGEHTAELQSPNQTVCRLLLGKKKKT